MSTQFSKEQVGQPVTVIGQAVNRKNGACLVTPNGDVWMEGLSTWPEEICAGAAPGKQVGVTGVLAEDQGLPVFVAQKDQPIVQGIPVAQGTNLQQASHRWLLKNATWTVGSA